LAAEVEIEVMRLVCQVFGAPTRTRRPIVASGGAPAPPRFDSLSLTIVVAAKRIFGFVNPPPSSPRESLSESPGERPSESRGVGPGVGPGAGPGGASQTCPAEFSRPESAAARPESGAAQRAGSGRCCFYTGRAYAFSESVGYRLGVVVTLMRREIDRRMAEHELTDAQWKPLWLLAGGHASTVLELARELELDPGAVPRLVDRLEAKQLLTRDRSEHDRRVVRLVLTAAGREVALEVPTVLADVNNALLEGLDEREWQELRRLLERLLANAKTFARGGHAEPTR
jgi:DNA-binding MarR family transcriptional regulator